VQFPEELQISLKVSVIWDVAQYNVYKFTDVSQVLAAYIIRTTAASTSETSANFHQTTRRNIPEASSSNKILLLSWKQ
jgi:hypothetical protein